MSEKAQNDLLFFRTDEEVRESSTLKRQEELIRQWHAKDKIRQGFNLEMVREMPIPTTTFDPAFFADDLYLETVVNRILQPKNSSGVVYRTLSHPSTDHAVIKKRQEAIFELLQDPKKVKYLEDVVEKIWQVAESVHNRYGVVGQQNISWGTSGLEYAGTEQEAQVFAYTLHALRTAQELVHGLKKDLAMWESEPFKQLAQRAGQIEQSEAFKEADLYIYAFSNHSVYRADVTVYTNAVGGFTGMKIHNLKPEPLAEHGGLVKWSHSWMTKSILKHINQLFADNSNMVKELIHVAGAIEFYLSGVRYANVVTTRGYPVCFPQFGDDHRIEVSDLLNPLLLLQEGTTPVTIDFSMNEDSFGRIITGPNNGGKSIALRALGLMYALAQAGFPIPVRAAYLHCIDGLYTHFPSRDDPTGGKGSFLKELTHDGMILQRATTNSFTLLDEPCIGTEPDYAAEQTQTFVEYLHREHIPFVIATHMHRVSAAVERGTYHGVTNLQAEVKFSDGVPELTYKIIPGRAGQSYGAAVAHQVGVDRQSLGLPAKD